MPVVFFEKKLLPHLQTLFICFSLILFCEQRNTFSLFFAAPRFLSLSLGFLIALTVFVAPVKKANAGIALLAAAATYDENYYYYGGGCFFFSSTYIIYPANGLEIFALMMIILDQKGKKWHTT